MKYILFSILCLSVCITAIGQQAKRDSIVKSVQEHRSNTFKAATTFLNERLGESERIKAIDSFSTIYDEKQIHLFKKLLLSENSSAKLKATALSKIHNHINTDEVLLKQVIQWFSTPKTDKTLRNAAFTAVQILSFSHLLVLDEYKKMLADPDLAYRTFAISKLVIHGDARTQQLLIKGFTNPEGAILDPAASLKVLALSPKKEFYPEAYTLLLNTKDEAVRLLALETLGPYKEARTEIIKISQNSKEKAIFRKTALMALYAVERDQMATYVLPILRDRSATEQLQVLGIQMLQHIRKSMSYRKKVEKADDTDTVINAIAQGKGILDTPQLRKSAQKYLQMVKPTF